MHGEAARAVGIRNAVQKRAETSRTGRPPLSAFTLSLSAAYIGGKGECNVNVYLFSAVVLLLPALCTALGAAGVFLVRRADEPRTRRMLCGMAAGIMLAASVWSLLLPAIERAEAGPLPVWLAPAAGLVLGAVGLLRLEEAAGRLMHGGGREHGRMGRVVLAVTLHNLPEGMVIGASYAADLAEAGEDGRMMALVIGLHNIPEGMAVGISFALAAQAEDPALLTAADKLGIQYVASGHYARMETDAQGVSHLLPPESGAPDESSRLAALSPEVLARLILPLGDFAPEDVEEMAADFKL